MAISKQQLYGGLALVLGIACLILLFTIFSGRKPKSAEVYEEKVRLLDSVLAARQQTIDLLSDRAGELRGEVQELKKENQELKAAYIENQERHVIINRKTDEIPNTIRRISSKDSLRRAGAAIKPE